MDPRHWPARDSIGHCCLEATARAGIVLSTKAAEHRSLFATEPSRRGDMRPCLNRPTLHKAPTITTRSRRTARHTLGKVSLPEQRCYSWNSHELCGSRAVGIGTIFAPPGSPKSLACSEGELPTSLIAAAVTKIVFVGSARYVSRICLAPGAPGLSLKTFESACSICPGGTVVPGVSGRGTVVVSEGSVIGGGLVTVGAVAGWGEPLNEYAMCYRTILVS